MGTIPVWLKDFIDKTNGNAQLVDAGIGNLLNNFPLVMRACGFLSAPSFQSDFRSLVERYEVSIREETRLAEQPPSVCAIDVELSSTDVELSSTNALLKRIAADPYAFWSTFYVQKFGDLGITLPALPSISDKTCGWIEDGSLLPIFLSAQVTQDAYPEGWVRSNWGRYIDARLIEHYPFPGRWVVIELVYKPDWNDTRGYGEGNDRLARKLDLSTRFMVSWDHLRVTLCQQTAKLWGLEETAVRPLTAEEWNLFSNILLELNRLHGTQFQDLGATTSWEWTESAYGSDRRVVVGRRGRGGLAGVHRRWSNGLRGDVSFRLLGVL